MNLSAVGALFPAPQFLPDRAPIEVALLGAVPELARAELALEGVGARARVRIPPASELVAAAAACLAQVVDDALAGRPTLPTQIVPGTDRLVDALGAELAAVPRGADAWAGALFLRVAAVWAQGLARPTGELATAVGALRTKAPEVQGTLLERIAGGLQGRLAAVVVATEAAGRPAPPLAQAVAGSRLALVVPAGPLDVVAELPRLGPVVRNPLPAGVAAAIPGAVKAAVGAILARRSSGGSTPDDQVFLLRHCPPERAASGNEAVARATLLDPDATALLLSGLGRWVDAKALAAAGEAAAGLAAPGAGLAAAAAWGELLADLRRWEVLSTLAAAVDDAAMPGLEGAARGGPGAEAVVVAVGLGRARAAVADDPERAAVFERAWDGARRAASAPSEDLGPIGLVLFDEPLAALRFVVRLPARFADARVRPAIGVGVGEVRGSPDPRGLRVWGPGVDAALRWLAVAALEAPKGLRRLGVVNGALAGDGIGVADGVRGLVAEAGSLPQRCTPGEVRAGTEIGLAVELDDVIAVFAGLGQVTGGWELLRLSDADWRALPVGGATRSARPGAVPTVGGVKPPGPAPAPKAAASAAPPVPPATPPVASAPVASAPVAAGFVVEEAPKADPFADAPAPRAAPAAEPSAVGDPFAGGDPFADRAAPSAGASAPVGSGDPFAAAGDPFAAAPAVPAAPPPVAEPAPPPAPPVSAAPAPSGGDEGLELDLYGDLPELADEPAPPAPLVALPDADPFATAAPADPFSAVPVPLVADPSEGPPDPFAGVSGGGGDDPFGSPAAGATGGDWLDGLLDDPSAARPAEPRIDLPPAPPAPRPSPPMMAAAAPLWDPGDAPPSDQRTDSVATAADSPAPTEPPARAPASQAAALPASQLASLFAGYVSVTAGGEIQFGQPYGRRLVDRHAYPADAGLDAAYRAFLGAKIGEGFVLRTDLIGDLPHGATLVPIDLERLARALAAS